MKQRHAVLSMLVALSVITFLDRLCISVAGPRMQDELGIPPERWGWVLAPSSSPTVCYEHLGPVLRFPAHCERVEAIYHEGLKRYLLAVSYNHRGGWGIYEAPHPSGYDVAGVFRRHGPGLHYDAFCTRRMRLGR